MRNLLLLLLATAPLSACAAPQQAVAPAALAPAQVDGTLSLLWTQTSVEFSAVTRAAFSQATLVLPALVADPAAFAAVEQTAAAALPPAVVLDLDETVLDNSAYQVWLIKTGQSYASDTWAAWCDAGEATLVPGAREFLLGAVAQGVTPVYISNRDASCEAATRRNLEAAGIPIVEADGVDAVLLKKEQPTWGSDKGSRRLEVAKRFRIVMLVGDNFGDFLDGVSVSIADRAALAQPYLGWWGSRWIAIPNPQYGSWDAAAFGHKFSTPPAEQTAARVAALRGWSGPSPK
jgi:acid phosphatase